MTCLTCATELVTEARRSDNLERQNSLFGTSVFAGGEPRNRNAEQPDSFCHGKQRFQQVDGHGFQLAEVGDRHGLGAAPSDQFKVANFTFSVTVLPCEPLCSANISRICWETAL